MLRDLSPAPLYQRPELVLHQLEEADQVHGLFADDLVLPMDVQGAHQETCLASKLLSRGSQLLQQTGLKGGRLREQTDLSL